jgi:cell wall-associated NlpC family hydrolase
VDRKSSTSYDAAAAIAEARSYLGVKWRHRGRTRFGIDCIGLLVAAVEAGGVPMHDRRDYGREPWRDGLEGAIAERLGDPVTGEWLPGDVALMRWENRPEAGHVGIIGSDQYGLTLIHCHSMSSVIEHRIDEHWRRLILGVYRP